MNKITFPIGYYPDPTKGKPISGGSIYVGEPDTDPTVPGNQKTVTALQENGSEVSISQPILTSAGGVPLYNGSPVSLFVDGRYSIRVNNALGSQEYYIPDSDIDSLEETDYVNTFDNIAALKAITSAPETSLAIVKGYYSDGDGGGGKFYWDATSTETDNSGTIIKATSIATGRWKRLYSGEVNVKWFGAKGDDSTDDTTAIAAAVTFIKTLGYNLYFPKGTYLTDPISLDAEPESKQSGFIGEERTRTTIKRKTAGAGAFITVGDPLNASYQADIGFKNITLDGGVTTSGSTFVGYNIVRSTFKECSFKGGNVGCYLFGGISVSFKDCRFEYADIGIRIQKFTDVIGAGWPNIIRIIGGEVVDNESWGVHFNDGRSLILSNVEVEGNGTTLGEAEGGVYIGPNIGGEVSVTDPTNIGLIADGCWFEANKGAADVALDSGNNTVSNSTFFSSSVEVTNDISIVGGNYILRNLNMSFSKTANISEGSGASSGNIIEMVQAANLSYNAAKTTVLNGEWINLQQGRVPSINGTTAPMILLGTDSTGVNPTITFSTAFKVGTNPKVYLQVLNDSSGTIDAPEVYSVSRTGFTVRKKSFNGSTIGTVNYAVYWMAIGESP